MAETEVKTEGGGAPSALEKKVARQVEYYFGDANLKRDTFLQLQIREDNGWVALETMIKFNRLKSLTTDFDIIVAALEKSPSGLMEISEDKLKIRRAVSKPLPEETAAYWQSMRARSVYCKGFPIDANLDTMQEFMDQFGECVHIQLRRDKEKKFKGSIFAVYESVESVKRFLDAEDLKIGDQEVNKMKKDDYIKMKADEKKSRKEDEKKKKLEQREQKEKDQVEAIQSEFDDYEKGCILHFTGVNDQTSREDLKELFGDHGTIQWVDFERGQTEGTIRFSEDTKAQETLDKIKAATEGAIQVRGCELTLRVLEGEEEEHHWMKVFEDKSRARLKKQQGRRGRKTKWFEKRDNRRGDRGGDRDRGDRDREDRYQGKKTKFEDDDEGGNGASEAVKPEQGVKRPADDGDAGKPSPKKEKTEDS
ncbi:lupus La protein homolog [Strongylocentrotus purpuratus]|uniref:Lupus La protein n=1 Tax=Strongylocentrotus purpuratus TaxID=7668 RepID=A0A7M7N3N7_STRPU|nr:lupus La protein homolog [Strongylocentrotus purpuratus]